MRYYVVVGVSLGPHVLVFALFIAESNVVVVVLDASNAVAT